MADSNLAQLAYRKEVDYNELAVNTDVLTILRYTSESLSYDITNTASQEIRADRSAADLIQTGASTSGGFNFELSAQTFDDFIAGAMYGEWSTQIAVSSSTTISSDMSASTITNSATNSFTHVSVGQWIAVQGIGTPSTMNYFRVFEKTSASVIKVFGTPALTTQAAGTAITILGSVIRNGITETSFAFEKKIAVNSDTATNVFFQYHGMIVSQMSLSAKSDAVLTGSFAFMGARPGVTDLTAYNSTSVLATTTPVLNATSNVGGVFEGKPFALIANCLIQGVDISLNNNLRQIKGIGQKEACDIGVGQCDVTGSLAAYFFDKSLYLKYINGTESALSFRVIDSTGKGYIITLPRIKIETDKTNIGGSNQDIMEQMTFRALYDSVTNCTIQIDRIAY